MFRIQGELRAHVTFEFGWPLLIEVQFEESVIEGLARTFVMWKQPWNEGLFILSTTSSTSAPLTTDLHNVGNLSVKIPNKAILSNSNLCSRSGPRHWLSVTRCY